MEYSALSPELQRQLLRERIYEHERSYFLALTELDEVEQDPSLKDEEKKDKKGHLKKRADSCKQAALVDRKKVEELDG